MLVGSNCRHDNTREALSDSFEALVYLQKNLPGLAVMVIRRLWRQSSSQFVKKKRILRFP